MRIAAGHFFLVLWGPPGVRWVGEGTALGWDGPCASARVGRDFRRALMGIGSKAALGMWDVGVAVECGGEGFWVAGV
jgi:hypothetical protein